MPTARRRDSVATRGEILVAARESFNANGYERTTIRGIAVKAGVDPALVIHYFGAKERLFAAAAALDIEPLDLTGVPPGGVAEVLVPMFARAWGAGGPLIGLLRAAATNAAAAEALRTLFVDTVAPTLASVARDHHVRRAGLIGAHLVGIAVSREIIGTPLVDMTDEELTAWLRPVIEHYLTVPAPEIGA